MFVDDSQFDHLARSLGVSRSRRTAAGLVGALAALPLLASVTAEAKKKKGKKKKGKKGKGKKKPTTTQPPGTTPRPCSVRPADNLQAAIDAAPAGSTLALCAGAWNLVSQVTIRKNLTLTGAGAGQTILDGGGTTRVMVVNEGNTVMLRDMTIRNGDAVDSLGGGIHTSGNLTLRGVAVTDCMADTGGGMFISAGAVVLDEGTQVTRNFAQKRSGDIAPGLGGGIFHFRGTLRLAAGSSVSGNRASDSGGGIQSAAPAQVTLEPGSTVAGNVVNATADPQNDVPDNCQPNIGTCT
jgi:hypothetical protein